MCSEEDASAEL